MRLQNFNYFILIVSTLVFIGCKKENTPVNIVLITADDLNWNSVGVYGCEVDSITPNIDQLAADGLYFNNAHVTVAVCQPSRGVMLTGCYPHKSGIEGFYHIDGSTVTSLVEEFSKADYLTGILSKVDHSSPKQSYVLDLYVADSTQLEHQWDYIKYGAELGLGRDPQKYYNATFEFIENCKKENKAFFLMANSNDPHRPFALSDQEKTFWPENYDFHLSRIVDTTEIQVSGFLPELPEIKREVAEYYSSVHRCDETVGAVLKALEQSGLAESTLVLFISDNGMSIPFAKSNCYLNSTKTPFIIRWPGKIKPNTAEERIVASLDIFPTLLEACGLSIPEQADGKSLMGIINGKPDNERKYVFTEYNETSTIQRFPMRCVQDEQFGYIFNIWADGETAYSGESQQGRTFRAMRQAAKENTDIAQRIKHFEKRTMEEFYDFKGDPNCKNNLVNDLSYQEKINELRKALELKLKETGDPAYAPFIDRYNPEAIQKYLNVYKNQTSKVPPVKVENLAIGSKISYTNPHHPKYNGGSSANALIDGWLAPNEMGNKKNYEYWQGFEHDNMEVVIDFGEIIDISELSAGFLQNQPDWIFFPTSVLFSTSYDGENYQTGHIVECPISPKNADLLQYRFTKKIKTKARFVKVFAENMGICPSWHWGPGGDAFIFCDEIIVL